MNAPPPGWYPDPDGTFMQRYWDGQQWSEVHAPGRKPLPSWVVLLLVLVGVVVASGLIDTLLSR